MTLTINTELSPLSQAYVESHKRIREELKEDELTLSPPALKRQCAVTSRNYEIIDIEEEEKKEETPESVIFSIIDRERKPAYFRENISPFGDYIFNYELIGKIYPNREKDNPRYYMNYRQKIFKDMDFLRRLLYDFDTHIDFEGCREERLKTYRAIDQMMHFQQLEVLPQPTGDEICMNPPLQSSPPIEHILPKPDDCFSVSPFDTRCDNILHDHSTPATIQNESISIVLEHDDESAHPVVLN